MQVDHLEAILGDVVITVYEGEYDEENGEYSGPGIARLDNENIYEGDFVKGLFHGKGKFTWANGMIYEGDFKYNKLTGNGTYTYLDGSIYVGQVWNGKRHGNGKLTNSTGQIYDGEWVMGKRHGNGKMIYNEEGNYVYTGEWIENLRHGYGTMKYPSGNAFEGEWRDDKKNGYGIMIWRDLDEVYTGDWMEDKPHGYGEHIWGDSSAKTIKKQNCNIYRGNYEDGKRNGFGTFFYMNGSQYSGQWRDDIKEGAGIFVYSDGRIIAGNYANNRLISSLDKEFQNLRVTEDINPQYSLNLTLTYFHFYPLLDGNPFQSLSERKITQTKLVKDIERLLLKYNSPLKSVYRYYNELTNKQRTREIPFIPNLETLFGDEQVIQLVSKEHQQRYYKFLKSTIIARNIQKRFYCLNMEYLIRLLREMSLIDFHYTVYDLMKAYQQFKADQLTLSMKQYGELVKKIVKEEVSNARHQQQQQSLPDAEEGTTPADGNDLDDIDQQSTVSSLLQEADLQLGRLLDDYQDIYAYDSAFYQQSNQPILEHEFIELLVRIIGERELRRDDRPYNLYHATERILAKQVLPFSSNPDLTKNQFYQLFYDPVVQDLLRGRANRMNANNDLLSQKIENIWKSFPKVMNFQQSITLIPTGGTVLLKEVVQYFLSFKEMNYLPPEVTSPQEILPIIFNLSTEVKLDINGHLSRKIHYEDFLEYLCRIVVSNYWLSSSKKNTAFALDETILDVNGVEELKESANVIDDEFNVIASAGNTLSGNNNNEEGLINGPESPSHEENFLHTRLSNWLNTI